MASDAGSLPKKEMLQRALKLYVETGNLIGQSNVHGRLGGGAFQRGQMAAAQKSYASAAELAEGSGDTGSTIYAELGLENLDGAGEIHTSRCGSPYASDLRVAAKASICGVPGTIGEEDQDPLVTVAYEVVLKGHIT